MILGIYTGTCIFISHRPTWYRDTKYTIIYVQYGSLLELGREITQAFPKGPTI